MQKLIDRFVTDNKLLNKKPFYSLHDIIKVSSGIILRTILNQNNNRLIIHIPTFDKAVFDSITFLSILELIKLDYSKKVNQTTDYKIGQKLLVNGAAVGKYAGMDSDNKRIWLQSSSGEVTIPLSQINKLQPVETERVVSSLNQILKAKLKNKQFVLDDLLGIEARGNHKFFNSSIIYVTAMNEANDFLNTEIREEKIKNLFLWGKLSYDGTTQQISSSQFLDTQSSAIIAQDLISVKTLIKKETHQINCVIIKNINNCINYLNEIDYLADNNIPIIIGSNPLSIDLIDQMKEKQFVLWDWSTDLLTQTFNNNRLTIPRSFSKEIKRHINKNINTITCQWPALEKLMTEIFKLKNQLDFNIPQISDIYFNLYKITSELRLLIINPDDNWKQEKISFLDLIFEKLKKERIHIEINTFKKFNEIIINCKNLVIEQGTIVNNKLINSDELKLLYENNLNNTYAVMKDTQSKVIFENAIRNFDRTNRFKDLLIIADILKNDQIYEHVIFPGWLGKNKMEKIFSLNNYNKLDILLYPFELEWYTAVYNNWKRKINLPISSKKIYKIIGGNKKDLEFIDKTPIIDKKIEDQWDIIDFEFSINRQKYSIYQSKNRDKDKDTIATAVTFSNGDFGFFSDSNKLLTATDFFNRAREGATLISKTVNNIAIGDYVVFSQTNRDFLKEITQYYLIKNGSQGIIDNSEIWWKELEKYMIDESVNYVQLNSKLRSIGCKVNKETVKHWVKGYTIGPRDSSVLDSISKVTGSKILINKKNEIMEGIKIVRSTRMSMANQLQMKLKSNIQQMLLEESGLRDSYTINIENIGIANILIVDEIDNEKIFVDDNIINRIISS